jgi:hypothetical protein
MLVPGRGFRFPGPCLSRSSFEDLSAREAGQVLDIGLGVLAAARKMAGDHVQHNPYFRDFPFNVPATRASV